VSRTHRLELDDQTLREWDAAVLEATPDGIVLDRSAFYPGGGGQPPDHGVLLWGGVQTRIVDARKGDDVYFIPGEGDPLPPVGTTVRGAVEDERRTALMRTHSGLHVLCGVVFRDYGALVTGGNMEALTARMDFNLEAVPPGFKESYRKAIELEEVLREGKFQFETDKVLRFSGACGSYLGKLSKSQALRVSKRVNDGYTFWTINPPSATNGEK